MHGLGEWTQVESDDGFLQPTLRGGDDSFAFVSHSVIPESALYKFQPWFDTFPVRPECRA
jgi:hypothetical protein